MSRQRGLGGLDKDPLLTPKQLRDRRIYLDKKERQAKTKSTVVPADERDDAYWPEDEAAGYVGDVDLLANRELEDNRGHDHVREIALSQHAPPMYQQETDFDDAANTFTPIIQDDGKK